MLKEGNLDVPSIINTLQKERKSSFPYLSGIKLSNYWLFILSSFTDAKFKNSHKLSIIPDTHIIKSTIKLGLLPEGSEAKDVEEVWREVLGKVNILPSEMHSVLWNWSRNNFHPEV